MRLGLAKGQAVHCSSGSAAWAPEMGAALKMIQSGPFRGNFGLWFRPPKVPVVEFQWFEPRPNHKKANNISMGWASRPSVFESRSSWFLPGVPGCWILFGIATSVCPANEQPRTWGGKRRETKTLLLFGHGSTGSNRPTGEHKQALRTTRELNRCKEEARLWLFWSKRRATSISGLFVFFFFFFRFFGGE